MNTEFSVPSATEKYLSSRDALRAQAKAKFFAHNPNAAPLVASINDYVATSLLGLSGQDTRPVPNGPYVGALIISFVRTHFIIIDLVTCCELIEAATLLRKQFELLARLKELRTSETIEHLLRRTPNLSTLETPIKTLYGMYSEIAHSSTPEWLELLGRIEQSGEPKLHVYPAFDKNAYVALSHVAHTVFEYYIWAHQFFCENFPNYSKDWAEEWLFDAIQKMNSYLPEAECN